MPKIKNLLFVIADDAHARFVRPAAGNTFHNDAGIDWSCPSSRAAATASDDHANEPGQPADHAPATHHDFLALEKTRFCRAIATRLNAEAAADNFEELVVVAPPHTLLAIRQRLNAVTDTKLVGTMPKDLARLADAELWPHLRPWIHPNQHIGA